MLCTATSIPCAGGSNLTHEHDTTPQHMLRGFSVWCSLCIKKESTAPLLERCRCGSLFGDVGRRCLFCGEALLDLNGKTIKKLSQSVVQVVGD